MGGPPANLVFCINQWCPWPHRKAAAWGDQGWKGCAGRTVAVRARAGPGGPRGRSDTVGVA